MEVAQFIGLEEYERDLIISFALPDPKFGIKSLILQRSLFFEQFLDEAEKGVKVSLEEDELEDEHFNILRRIKIDKKRIEIETRFKKYVVDISNIENTEMERMLELLGKQNYDKTFEIQIA